MPVDPTEAPEGFYAEAGIGCRGCHLVSRDGLCGKIGVHPCVGSVRNDGTSVIFKKKEPPMVNNIEHHIRLAAERAAKAVAKRVADAATAKKEADDRGTRLKDVVSTTVKSLLDIAIVIADASGARLEHHSSFRAVFITGSNYFSAESGCTRISMSTTPAGNEQLEVRARFESPSAVKVEINVGGFNDNRDYVWVSLKDEAEFAAWIGEYIALVAHTNGKPGDTCRLFSYNWNKQ